MLKTQRFSSLFRHYAKYHGLRKDDLEYYFVNPLENEDTPESVQLQRSDTIMVRKRRRPEPPEAAADDDEFFKDMRELLDDEEHMDAVFLVHADASPNRISSGDANANSSTQIKKKTTAGVKRDVHGEEILETAAGLHYKTPDKIDSTSSMNLDNDESFDDLKLPAGTISNHIRVRAHKCVLTARAEYFKAHFRKASSLDSNLTFLESSSGDIHVDPCFSEKTIRFMLEFIYTNRIQNIANCSTDDLLSILHLSDQWLLRDLKRLVEHELIRSHMDVNTVARMYCVTDDYHASRLASACIDYIMENIREVTGNKTFQEEMKHYPHLCIPVLKAAAELIPEQPSAHKKARTSEHSGIHNPTNAGLSSPVPDSDL